MFLFQCQWKMEKGECEEGESSRERPSLLSPGCAWRLCLGLFCVVEDFNLTVEAFSPASDGGQGVSLCGPVSERWRTLQKQTLLRDLQINQGDIGWAGSCCWALQVRLGLGRWTAPCQTWDAGCFFGYVQPLVHVHC